MSTEDDGYKIALQEAILGSAEGGIPVGACLAETAAFEGERLYPKGAYKDATLYTTLSPCWMCTGAALWFQVKRVVIGDSQSFTGPEDVLRREGVEVVVLNTRECVQLTERFRARAPEQWEDEIAR